MAVPISHSPAERGAATYRGLTMIVYDWWVLQICNSFAWCCPTSKYLLPLFQSNIREKHLDIGVGTGYYLKHANIPCYVNLTLCDLNSNSLRIAKARCGRPDAKELLCDITKPLPTIEKFDSMTMYFLLHCLPGPAIKKTVVFEHIKHNLMNDGVVTGATVLGSGVPYNFFARQIRKYVLKEGIMDNRDDDAETFIRALKDNFHSVEADVVGTVLIFKAAGPKV